MTRYQSTWCEVCFSESELRGQYWLSNGLQIHQLTMVETW